MTAQTFSKEEIRSLYGQRASRYDVTSHLYGLIGYRLDRYRRQAIEQLRLRPGETILEIGCGTGANFARLLASVGETGRVIGIDLSEAMLEQARQRARREGWRNVTLIAADAARCTIPGSVHGILASYALSVVPACDEVVARAAEALEPGGHFVIVDIRAPASWPESLFRALLPLVRPFGVTDELGSRRPWEALARHLELVSMEHRYLGTTYIAVAERRPHEHVSLEQAVR